MAKKRGNGEGSIYRRKDGRWVGQYTIRAASGPKRKTVYGKTRAEVAAKLARAIAESNDGFAFDAGNLSVGEYLDRWLDSVGRSVRIGTHARYEQLCRCHIRPALGGIKLTALSPAHVDAFYRGKLDTDLSPRTVQYMHDTLRKALNQAVKWGLVPRNVCAVVDAPKPARRDIRPLSPAQIRRLLSAASGDRLEALYVLAVTTGLRQGELLGLAWSGVDLEAGRVRVRRTLIACSGKPTFGRPKTSRGRRTVALTGRAVDALRRHEARQRAEGTYAEDGLVFCTGKGTPLTRQNLTQRSFKPLLKHAGLPEIRFHDLRHTAATLLLGRGVHPRIVQDMLGHAQITLTLDTYSHVLPDMQAGAADAMRAVLEDDEDGRRGDHA